MKIQDVERAMKGKKYFYEVNLSRQLSDTFGTVLADSDAEAIEFARVLYPKAVFIRLNEYGYGPRLYLEGVK